MYPIVTSKHGRRLGLGANSELIATGGLVVGDFGAQIVFPSPRHVALFDDFTGDVVADQWNYAEGSDTTTADGAIQEGVNGVFLLTSGDSAGSVAADGALLNSALSWKASQDELRFVARVKLASIASVSCFIGFTDTKALEQPIYSAASSNTLTSDATDAVGWMFDTSMASANWWLTGVKADTDASAQNSAVAPAADSYETLGIAVDAYGTAKFFRNGVPVGDAMANAVSPSVALTPAFFIRPRSAVAGKTLSIDWVNVSALRV